MMTQTINISGTHLSGNIRNPIHVINQAYNHRFNCFLPFGKRRRGVEEGSGGGGAHFHSLLGLFETVFTQHPSSFLSAY